MTEQNQPSRRDFMATAAVGTGSLALSAAASAATSTDAPKETAMSTAPAFQTSDKLKPLAFDAAKLTGLSERLIRSHWENNYGGSVKALAVVKKRLGEALGDKDLPPYVYNDRYVQTTQRWQFAERTLDVIERS